MYLRKVDLADNYMRILVHLKDTPSVELLLPKNGTEDEQLVGFHLYLPMGYVDSAPYFCMSMEKIIDITNSAMDGRHTEPPHPSRGTLTHRHKQIV